MNRDGSRQSSSNYGSTIEFDGYAQALAAGAPSKGSARIVELGRSSGGSASVGGIAPLAWRKSGRNPTHEIVIQLKAPRPFLAGALVEVLPEPNDEGDPGAGYGNNGEVLE
jgi:hypothetical protein